MHYIDSDVSYMMRDAVNNIADIVLTADVVAVSDSNKCITTTLVNLYTHPIKHGNRKVPSACISNKEISSPELNKQTFFVGMCLKYHFCMAKEKWDNMNF